MKIAGIIAEYNPFHNGHKYHLEQAKSVTGAEAVVAVISGSVTQRGEPAFWDKWDRAEMAVKNGADLVLELPFAFSCNSAEEFARGGVSILNSLGCVTDLVFGCESDPELVIAMARASAEQEEAFSQKIRQGLDAGMSYPAARSLAMTQFLPDPAIASLDRPNDILAAEYVRQLVLQESDMVPHGVLRRGEYHDMTVTEGTDPSGGERFSSATAVRQAVREGRWDDVTSAVPEETWNILMRCAEANGTDMTNTGLDRMDTMILHAILQKGPEGLAKIQGCSEGLEYRIWNALPKVSAVDELLKEVSSGRYPTARIRRLLMHALLGSTKELFPEIKEAANQGKLYARVLGFSETGAKILKQVKKTVEDLPVYTNLNRELPEEAKRFIKGETFSCESGMDPVCQSLKLDIRAADILRMGRGERLYDGSDFVKNPYIAHKIEKNHK